MMIRRGHWPRQLDIRPGVAQMRSGKARRTRKLNRKRGFIHLFRKSRKEAEHPADDQENVDTGHDGHDPHQDGAEQHETAGEQPSRKKSFSFNLKAIGKKKAAPARKEKHGKLGASDDITLEDGVVHFGKQKAAIGINWNILNDGEKLRDKAKALSEKPNDKTDFEVEYQTYIDLSRANFVGFGSNEYGHAAGIPALVDAVSIDISGPRWIGAFHLDPGSDTWWVGSMRDGQVYLDEIHRGESAAKSALYAELNAPDWKSVYVPDSWGVSGSRGEEIWEVVNFSSAKKLKQLYPIRANIGKILIVVVIAAAVGGGLHWYNDMKAKELAALEAIKRQREQQVELRPQDYPYHDKIAVMDFIEACEQGIEKAILLPLGWEAQPISCIAGKGGNGIVTAGWNSTGGLYSHLIAAMDPAGPLPDLSNDGANGSLTYPLPIPFSEDGFTDEPWTPDLIDSRLGQRFKLFSVNGDLRPTQNNKNVPGEVPVFNSTDVKISSAISLRNFGDILKDVPALVPESIIFNVATGNWDFVFKVYHPVMMPAPKRNLPDAMLQR